MHVLVRAQGTASGAGVATGTQDFVTQAMAAVAAAAVCSRRGSLEASLEWSRAT